MKRSILGFAFTADALRRVYQVPVDEILARYGMALDRLDPDARLDRGTELRLLSEMLVHVDDPLAGMRLGSRFSLPGYGPFAMLLMSCPNAFEACKVGVRYQSLAYVFGDIRFDLGAEESAIDIIPWELPPGVARFVTDRDIAGTLKLIDDISRLYDQPVTLKALWMPCPRPDNAAEYENRVPAPILWGQPHARLIADTRQFARAFDKANPVAFRLYKRICDRLLDAPDDSEAPLSGRITEYLRLFSGGYPDVTEVARFFSLPERTLRRRLADEGISFRKLLDGVRQERARMLMNTGQHTMDQIARELGYADTTALYRAMRRWSLA